MSAQEAAIAQLKAVGFVIEYRGRNVRMKRGNDYRLIRPDGSQSRAIGARR